jgi:hypothetical protein
VWLLTIALVLCGLGLLAFAIRPLRGPRPGELGVMSEQWLSEHRAASR